MQKYSTFTWKKLLFVIFRTESIDANNYGDFPYTIPRLGGFLMVNRENTCRACEGTGMLSDDEGWQYKCSVCHGEGVVSQTGKTAKVMSVDENNRLLD